MSDHHLGNHRDEVKIKNLKIAYQCRGKGQPLVLLHGALADSRVWRRQLDDLSDQFMVVAWDAPGCGRSSDPDEHIGSFEYAGYLAGFIEELGLKKPHLLGLSFGSVLALEFYRLYPAVPKTLLLVSAYAGWAGSLPPDVVEDRIQMAKKQIELPPQQVVENWIPTLFKQSVPTDVVEELSAIMVEFRPAGLKAMLSAAARIDLREMLPTINVPTLLLYGEEDQRSPLKVAEEMHSAIPGSTLVTVPGVGHVVNLEAPEVFNTEIRNFLQNEGWR